MRYAVINHKSKGNSTKSNNKEYAKYQTQTSITAPIRTYFKQGNSLDLLLEFPYSSLRGIVEWFLGTLEAQSTNQNKPSNDNCNDNCECQIQSHI